MTCALALLASACGASQGGSGATEATGTTAGTAATDDTGATAGTDETSVTSGQDTSGQDFDPIEATLDDVKKQVAGGPVACATLVTRYRELYEARNPKLKAILTWNDEAPARAAQLDALPVDQRGPLHCAPVVVKDNIDVAGLPTTGGVAALAKSVPAKHAAIVARLVDAGAVILGKTNMPDFALDGLDTDSSAGGHTVNAYDLSSTVYGSSGGTAAAITASLGIIGLGSDTFGSLVQPGSASSVVAIRSTQGFVPSGGILPLMTLQDVPGPMTRTVTDAAITLEVITGGQGFVAALDPDGLKGVTLGYDPATLQEVALLGLKPDPEVKVLFDATLADIAAAGATTMPVGALLGLFGSLQPAIDGFFACEPVDFKQGFEAYLQTLGPNAPVHSLAEVIASGAYSPKVEGFITGADAQTDTVESSMACQDYLSAKMSARNAVTKFMDDKGLDLMVFPAANQFPFPAGEDPPQGWFGFHPLSSVTGLPSLEMPMGLSPSRGLPIGLVLLARANNEDALIRAAYALEQARSPRVPPTLP